MNLRILVVSFLFAAVFLSVLSVPYANSQSSAATTTMTLMQPAGSSQCTVRSLAFSAVKGGVVVGTYGSDAQINLYILTQNETNSIQHCHLPSAARPLLAEENAVGFGNSYRSLPFPASGTYCFVFIVNGPTSVPSGNATVELSFPASTILINSAGSPNSATSLSSTVSPSSTTSLISTTGTPIILPTSTTSGSSSVTSQASPVTASRSFGTVGAVALVVVIALLGSVVLFMRKKKRPESSVTVEEKPSPKATTVTVEQMPSLKATTVTVEQMPSPKAEPLEQPPQQSTQPAASELSTGYRELDGLLLGGLPRGNAILLLSPRCDERDLLLQKIIGSALSAGMPTFYLSNDPSKIQDMASTYGKDFYTITPQAAKISAPSANLYRVPSVDSLTDLNMTFTRILETRVKQGTGNRLLVVDLLTYSRIFLVDNRATARKWFSDFLAKRKAEDFTVLAYLNPLVASNEETQTLIDVFDGVIEIYENELGGRTRRFLVIKRMSGHNFSDSELILDKDKLS